MVGGSNTSQTKSHYKTASKILFFALEGFNLYVSTIKLPKLIVRYGLGETNLQAYLKRLPGDRLILKNRIVKT